MGIRQPYVNQAAEMQAGQRVDGRLPEQQRLDRFEDLVSGLDLPLRQDRLGLLNEADSLAARNPKVSHFKLRIQQEADRRLEASNCLRFVCQSSGSGHS